MSDRNQASILSKTASGTRATLAWILRFFSKLVLLGLFVAFGLLIGGFLKFSSTVSDMGPSAKLGNADAVVALTGGSTRIAKALDLISDKKAKRLLISGVNTETRVADLAKINPSRSSLFSCCVDVERVAMDTIGNARETKKWMDAGKRTSMILVTSTYHMPRSLLEFRRLMPDITIIPYPVRLDVLADEDWWKNSGAMRLMLAEYLKYVGAQLRTFVGPQTLTALRGNVLGG